MLDFIVMQIKRVNREKGYYKASERKGISSDKQNCFETIFNAIKTLFTMIIS